MIHLNIGSNLDSEFGNRFDNISSAINLLVNSSLKINKISNFYETPSYPNKKFPKFINVGVSDYWKSDYIFGKDSAKRNKKISKSFLELLTINTIIPLKYSYEKHIGTAPSEMLFQWAQKINPEKNSIVSGFEKLKIIANSALDSQSLIEVKTNYCDLKKCLNCSVRYSILIPTKRNGQN